MAASGWYPDPLGHSEYRYFDGEHWTDQVSTAGTVGIDPPVDSTPLVPAEAHPPPPLGTTAPEAPAAKRPVGWLVAGGVLLVALLAAVAVLLTRGGDGDSSSAVDTVATSEETDEGAAATTTTEPATTTTQETTDGSLTPEDEAACRYLLDEIDAPGGYDPQVVFPTVADMATDGGEVQAAANRALTSFQDTGDVGATEAADLVVACSSVL